MSAVVKDWWDIAHKTDHAYWLSGTPGEEVWKRLGVRDRLKPGLRVLNIGVGLGRDTRELVALGCNVSVLDISETALERVKDVAAGWIDPAQLPDNTFDLALSHLVAQHQADLTLQEQIENVLRSLKPGCMFAIQYAAHAHTSHLQGRDQIQQGSVYRKPGDFAALVHASGGAIADTFERETFPCGTIHYVAYIVRA